MGLLMSILYPYSVAKVHKILRFETVFHDSASDCTKLTLDYGKEEEKLKKSSMFDLRTKSLLIKDEILIGIANDEPHQWIEGVKTVIVKMSKLGNMMLLLDGYVVAHSMRGHSIEDFN